MKQDLKKALEDAYEFKKPMRKEKFFQDLHNEAQNQKKPVSFYIKALRYSAVPVTAAIAVLIFTGFINNSSVKNEFVSRSVSTDYADNCDSENASEETIYDTDSEYTSIATSVSKTETNDNISSLSAASSTTIYHNKDNPPLTYDDAVSDTNDEDSQNNIKATTINTTVSSSVTTVTTIKTTIQTTTKTTYLMPMQTTTTYNHSSDETLPPVPSTTKTTDPDFVITTTTTYNNNHSDVNPEKNFWVKPTITYNKTDNIIDVTDILSKNDAVYDDYNWKISALNALDAVYGTVENIYYTSVYGVPYIQADISVQYSMGNEIFEYGDKISVYIPGGYMSLRDFISSHKWFEKELDFMTNEEINNYTVFNNNGTNTISKGSKLLFFLCNGLGDMPQGAFTLCNKMDIFIQRKSLNSITYINAIDRNIRFTDYEYKNLKG